MQPSLVRKKTALVLAPPMSQPITATKLTASAYSVKNALFSFTEP